MCTETKNFGKMMTKNREIYKKIRVFERIFSIFRIIFRLFLAENCDETAQKIENVQTFS